MRLVRGQRCFLSNGSPVVVIESAQGQVIVERDGARPELVHERDVIPAESTESVRAREGGESIRQELAGSRYGPPRSKFTGGPAPENGKAMLEAARKGEAKEIRAAWDFFQSMREASLPIIQEVMSSAYNRKLSRLEAERLYDEGPRLATRLKPFRDKRRELAEIAHDKGLTVVVRRLRRSSATKTRA